MYDWFVLFVCTVTEEPHQSPFSVSTTKRYTVKLKDYLYKAISVAPYLPRYPCHPSRASRWPHHIPDLSSLTGRCSARHSDPGRTSRCCCTARGSRLSTHHVRVKQPSEWEAGNQEEEEEGDKSEPEKDNQKWEETEWTYSTIHLWQDWEGWGRGVRGYCHFTWVSDSVQIRSRGESLILPIWKLFTYCSWTVLKAHFVKYTPERLI